jgi:hypothetical protein
MCIACEQFDGSTFVALTSEKLNTEYAQDHREPQRNPGFSFAVRFCSAWVSVHSVAFLCVLCVKFPPLFASARRARKIIHLWYDQGFVGRWLDGRAAGSQRLAILLLG